MNLFKIPALVLYCALFIASVFLPRFPDSVLAYHSNLITMAFYIVYGLLAVGGFVFVFVKSWQITRKDGVRSSVLPTFMMLAGWGCVIGPFEELETTLSDVASVSSHFWWLGILIVILVLSFFFLRRAYKDILFDFWKVSIGIFVAIISSSTILLLLASLPNYWSNDAKSNFSKLLIALGSGIYSIALVALPSVAIVSYANREKSLLKNIERQKEKEAKQQAR